MTATGWKGNGSSDGGGDGWIFGAKHWRVTVARDSHFLATEERQVDKKGRCGGQKVAREAREEKVSTSLSADSGTF